MRPTSYSDPCLPAAPVQSRRKRLASASGDLVWDDGKNELIKKPDADHGVHLWDVATGQRVLSLKSLSGFGGSAAFSPDGKQLVTGSQGGRIRIWDAGTGQEIRSFKENGIGNLAFSPDGKALIFGGADGIKLIDAATGQERLTSKSA